MQSGVKGEIFRQFIILILELKLEFSLLPPHYSLLTTYYTQLLPPTSLDAIWAGDKLVNLSRARNLQGGLSKCQPNMNL